MGKAICGVVLPERSMIDVYKRQAHTQPLSSNVFRMLGAVGLDKMDVSYNRLHLPNQAGDTLKKIG